MPKGDGTGPFGTGPITGRGAGYCSGFNVPGYANPAIGWWCGRGRGRGYRNMFYATGLTGWQRALMGWLPSSAPNQPTREQQIQQLKNQASYFEETLKAIRQKISELETTKE